MKAMEEVDRSGPTPDSVPTAPGMLQSSVVGVVNTHAGAEEVVKELQRSGFDMRRLSVVGKGYHSEERPLGFYTTGDRMKSWGGIGAFWGALWGLLFGAAFFWIPGIGPLAVAGPFVHMLVTGLEGAVLVGGAGALGGALISLGLSKDKAIKYESSLRADKYIIIAHGTRDEVEMARSVLYRNSQEEPDVVSPAGGEMSAAGGEPTAAGGEMSAAGQGMSPAGGEMSAAGGEPTAAGGAPSAEAGEEMTAEAVGAEALGVKAVGVASIAEGVADASER